MSNSVSLISACDLSDGDLYRTLDRSGDYVLTGELDDLLADEEEDAGGTVWRQIGEGDDAYRVAVAAV